MNEDQLYEWAEFRDHLAQEIVLTEHDGKSASYYEQWLASLEKLVFEKGLITPDELDARTDEYVSGERDDDE